MTTPLLRVDDLVVEYRTAAGMLRAVDEVSLDVARGETLAIVGESGCGKSTLGRGITRLVPLAGGSVVFGGIDLASLRGRRLRRARSRFQFIFQDPSSALNGRMRVGDLVREPLAIHQVGSSRSRDLRAREMLALVGLDGNAYSRFPHEFSGGERQRIAIARALVLDPELVVADEPTSSLDVSIQGQILLLLKEQRERLGLALLFISHDLAVVRALADRVAVMYLGRLVEIAPRGSLYDAPAHPYTQALLRAAPRMDISTPPEPLRGEVPSALRPPSGCRFRTRCPLAVERCSAEQPLLRVVASHLVACHRAEEALAGAARRAPIGGSP